MFTERRLYTPFSEVGAFSALIISDVIIPVCGIYSRHQSFPSCNTRSWLTVCFR